MEPTTFVLFGATGDLAKRKIYPALYNLFIDDKLPQSFSLIGLGRREWSDEMFQANVAQSLRQFSRRAGTDTAKIQQFIRAFRFSVLDIGREQDYEKLRHLVEKREQELGIPQNRLFYLSVGPEFFETIAANIKSSGLGATVGWKRLVIEKPFGHDLKSARALQANLRQSFTEDEVYRIDHYLGKPMLQGLETLRASNPVLQALLKNRYIANVQIIANEMVGVEERAGYYDHVGALRDMFQNHMLQLLMMTAIQLPYDSTTEQMREKKKQVIRALEPARKQDVSQHMIRGQYGEGSIQGLSTVAYTAEPGIAPDSLNDTFIAAKLYIDDYFWKGVPFYIRTGKRMKEKSTRIVIEFKDPLTQSGSARSSSLQPNLLVIEMSPDERITLQLNMHDHQHKGEIQPVSIGLHASEADLPEAYENLIDDAIHGDATYFAHWDEVELSWQWVQPILEAFAENLVPLHRYAAGSYGPAAADELLARDGHHWWFDARDEENHENRQNSTVYSLATS